MPSFCRHNRLESACPVCTKKRRAQEAGAAHSSSPSRATRPSAAQRRSGATRRRPATSGDMRVRRLSRAQDDGFQSELVPGLHASADAELLAEELAFALARLEALTAGRTAPGLYGEAARLARAGDGEEALWLAFLIALLGPLEGEDDAFAEIARVRVPWATGELPDLLGVQTGPRGAYTGARGTQTVEAYRAWAARAGSQAQALTGELAWAPERRADRAFERLALPGLSRAARIEYLLACGGLGLAGVRLAALHLMEDSRDPTVVAAKRVFGIGDPLLVARRAADLATAAAVPIAAFDLGLLNWARRTDDPEAARITGGVAVAPDAAARELVRAALGLPAAAAASAEPAL